MDHALFMAQQARYLFPFRLKQVAVDWFDGSELKVVEQMVYVHFVNALFWVCRFHVVRATWFS